jgi:hypothetical protein
MVSPVPRPTPRQLISIASAGLCLLVAASHSTLDLIAQTDLDAFMRQVLVRRDDNWKKLQQYVLDEHETIDVRGPSRLPLWGERRDYTWYIRDGFFVRSPVKVNGVTIAEGERRTFEAAYLKRQQEREKRGQRGMVALGPSGIVVEPADRDPVQADGVSPSVDGLLKQTRQPGFISSAYFLRFKFEEGKYALVGRETLDGREVLKIEYYPSRLFGGSDRRRKQDTSNQDRAYDAEFQRLMNKVALVTLWVEPKVHQIVKYTFNNLPFDFLPGQWLLHVDDLRASMTMGQPFPEVWLPRDLEFEFGISLAVGQVDMRYALEYHDYRRPDVTANVKVR